MFRNAQPGGSGCGLKPALTAVLIVMASAFLTVHEATRMPPLEQKNPKKSRPSGACYGHTVRHRNVRDGTRRCGEPSWAGPAALPRGQPPRHSQRVHVCRREPALTSRQGHRPTHMHRFRAMHAGPRGRALPGRRTDPSGIARRYGRRCSCAAARQRQGPALSSTAPDGGQHDRAYRPFDCREAPETRTG